VSTAPEIRSHAVYHRSLFQGSEEWLAARCGMLTASEMKLIVTPTFKAAANDKERSHLFELLAQRITGYVEPHYISDDMLRGQEDEIEACIAYGKHYVPVDSVGFVTNSKWSGSTSSHTAAGFRWQSSAAGPTRSFRPRSLKPPKPSSSGSPASSRNIGNCSRASG
jgi:hypothetical protein